MTDSTFDFTRMLCFALYSTANAMVRNYAKPLGDIGLTYPQLLVLAALWEEDDVSATALSRKTLYDLGALTPILRRLEESGFVIVRLDPSDRRRRNIALTDQGRALRDPAAEIFDSTRCRVDISPEDLAAVLRVCEKVKGRLEA